MNIQEFLTKKKADKSNYKLSKETGCSQSHLSRIFSGETVPSAPVFFKICKNLNVSKSEISKFYEELENN